MKEGRKEFWDSCISQSRIPTVTNYPNILARHSKFISLSHCIPV